MLTEDTPPVLKMDVYQEDQTYSRQKAMLFILNDMHTTLLEPFALCSTMDPINKSV